MKVNIILPFFSRLPGGGIKIMYTIANLLVEKGYEVKIYHNLGTEYTYPSNRPFIVRKFLASFFHGKNPKPKWFQLDSKIKSVYIDKITDNSIDDGDFILYTWWALGFDIQKLHSSKGEKFNLIQGYEVWNGYESLVHESYSLSPIKNICISHYLKNLVSVYSETEVEQIDLSVDSKNFFLKNKIEDRFDASIVMLYSNLDHIKGTNFALSAFEKLKTDIPYLQVTLFGVSKDRKRIPDWMNYYYNPTNLTDIYNNHAIFVSPSLTEGWALPPVEAMTCGCTFVGTNIPGHESYLQSECSISVPPKDSDAIYKAVKLLVEDHFLRVRIAKNGLEFTKRFTWENTMAQIESVFSKYN